MTVIFLNFPIRHRASNFCPDERRVRFSAAVTGFTCTRLPVQFRTDKHALVRVFSDGSSHGGLQLYHRQQSFARVQRFSRAIVGRFETSVDLEHLVATVFSSNLWVVTHQEGYS